MRGRRTFGLALGLAMAMPSLAAAQDVTESAANGSGRGPATRTAGPPATAARTVPGSFPLFRFDRDRTSAGFSWGFQDGAASQPVEKPEPSPRQGLVWDDRPSIRAGDWLRMDLRLKLQADSRHSEMDLTDYGGTNRLARSRAGVEGELFDRVQFEFEIDLKAEANEFGTLPRWRDAFVDVQIVPEVQVQVGRFKIPFGRDMLASIFGHDFATRALVTRQLAPGRDAGLVLHGNVFDSRLQYFAGAFRADGEESPIPVPPFAEEGESSPRSRSYAGRLVVEPAPGLSIGANAVTTDVPEGRNNLRSRSVLRYHTFRTFYVSGRRLRTGVDAEYTRGPVAIRTEYIRAEEQRLGVGVGNEQGPDNDLPDYLEDGWFVSGTWVLTGEKKAGSVTPARPLFQGGLGAFEVAARYEQLAFRSADTGEASSTSLRAANPGGNTETVLTLGANWYVNKWVKVTANGVRERIDDVTYSPVAPKTSFWSTVVRLQFNM